MVYWWVYASLGLSKMYHCKIFEVHNWYHPYQLFCLFNWWNINSALSIFYSFKLILGIAFIWLKEMNNRLLCTSANQIMLIVMLPDDWMRGYLRLKEEYKQVWPSGHSKNVGVTHCLTMKTMLRIIHVGIYLCMMIEILSYTYKWHIIWVTTYYTSDM